MTPSARCLPPGQQVEAVWDAIRDESRAQPRGTRGTRYDLLYLDDNNHEYDVPGEEIRLIQGIRAVVVSQFRPPKTMSTEKRGIADEDLGSLGAQPGENPRDLPINHCGEVKR